MIKLKWIKRNIGDISGLLGVGLISTGVLIYSVPIGLIVTGLMLVGVAYLMNVNGGD